MQYDTCSRTIKRENKYGVFDWGLQDVNATFLENLVQNPESQSNGYFFMCFAIVHTVLIITFFISAVFLQS